MFDSKISYHWKCLLNAFTSDEVLIMGMLLTGFKIQPLNTTMEPKKCWRRLWPDPNAVVLEIGIHVKIISQVETPLSLQL